ncbi:MAG: hypothetical protein KF729_36950 [Sandaracinaceae bacterium]|nr:hypothetical protein [Sandaracinaceae bacterium]
MIPSAEALIEGWAFLARRYGLSGAVDARAVGRVVALARACAAGAEADEPAALFFALSREPEAFAGGWRRATEVFPSAHAHALGWTLDATPLEVANQRLAVYAGRAGFEDTRAWFAARLRPSSR